MTINHERLYKHFGFTGENIPLQKQICTDIYNILKGLGFYPQSPGCVAISTKDGIHTIYSYPFNSKRNYWGPYQHSIGLRIKTDYEFESLEKWIKQQVKALFEKSNNGTNWNESR